jgi:hypothetical protein
MVRIRRDDMRKAPKSMKSCAASNGSDVDTKIEISEGFFSIRSAHIHLHFFFSHTLSLVVRLRLGLAQISRVEKKFASTALFVARKKMRRRRMASENGVRCLRVCVVIVCAILCGTRQEVFARAVPPPPLTEKAEAVSARRIVADIDRGYARVLPRDWRPMPHALVWAAWSEADDHATHVCEVDEIIRGDANHFDVSLAVGAHKRCETARGMVRARRNDVALARMAAFETQHADAEADGYYRMRDAYHRNVCLPFYKSSYKATLCTVAAICRAANLMCQEAQAIDADIVRGATERTFEFSMSLMYDRYATPHHYHAHMGWLEPDAYNYTGISAADRRAWEATLAERKRAVS